MKRKTREKLSKGFIWCLLKGQYQAKEFNYYHQWHRSVYAYDY